MSQQINLLNARFKAQKKVFGAKTMGQALLVFMAGLFVLAQVGEQRVKAMQVQVDASNARLKLVQARLAITNASYAPRPKDKGLETQITTVEAELQLLQTVAAILERGEFGNTSGYSDYFQAFARQNLPGMWLTGVRVTGAGTDIALEGRAMQADLVPGYISALKREKIMQGKSFDGMRINEVKVRKLEKNERGERVERMVTAPFIGFSLHTGAAADAAPAASEQGGGR